MHRAAQLAFSGSRRDGGAKYMYEKAVHCLRPAWHREASLGRRRREQEGCGARGSWGCGVPRARKAEKGGAPAPVLSGPAAGGQRLGRGSPGRADRGVRGFGAHRSRLTMEGAPGCGAAGPEPCPRRAAPGRSGRGREAAGARRQLLPGSPGAPAGAEEGSGRALPSDSLSGAGARCAFPGKWRPLRGRPRSPASPLCAGKIIPIIRGGGGQNFLKVKY